MDGTMDKRSKEVPFYAKSLPKLSAEAREILIEYAKVPEEQLESHVAAIRDEAWELFPYPCIGGYKFLDFDISEVQDYAEVQRRTIQGETLLDVGANMAQHLRLLVHHGALSENLYALDVVDGYYDVGYKLFNDRKTLKSTLLIADIFGADAALDRLDGSMDMICANSFFHLFAVQEQKVAAKRMLKFLKPKPGCLVFGRQAGTVSPHLDVSQTAVGPCYRHSQGSLKAMWRDIAIEEGIELDINTDVHDVSFSDERDKQVWQQAVGGSKVVYVTYSNKFFDTLTDHAAVVSLFVQPVHGWRALDEPPQSPPGYPMPIPNHTTVEPSLTLSPSPPSGDLVVKRDRGFSGSKTSTADLVSRSRSLHGATPMAQSPVPGPDVYRSRPSLDQPSFSRPSVSRQHTRQISNVYEPNIVRHKGPTQSQASAPIAPHNQRNVVQDHGVVADRRNGAAPPAAAAAASSATHLPPGTGLNGQPAPARTKSSRDMRSLKNSQSSESRASSNSQEAVGINDFGLRHLFTFFSHQARDKINACAASFERSPSAFRIEHICGPGVDTTFDMTIAGLGTVAKEHPKTLVDEMLRWRRHYDAPSSDAASTSHSYSLSTASQASSRAPSRAASRADDNGVQSPPPARNRAVDAAESAKTDLRMTAASFLLGRVMIEVLSQTTLPALTTGLARQLEKIIYDGQIDRVHPDELLRSPSKRAKWHIMARLLGLFSELDLEGISNRYLADIAKIQDQLGPKANTNTLAEELLVARLEGMQYFRLRSDTPEEWKKARNFMQSITELIAKTHGHGPKREYCRLLENVLLPLAEQTYTEPVKKTTTPDFANQTWKNIINQLQDRIQQLAKKPKYFHIALPVQIVLACVSGNDNFNGRWSQLLPIASIPSKLKSDADRSMYLKALCRLTWSYLRREGNLEANRIEKTLEDIARGVFFSQRRFSLSTDPAVVEPLIMLLRTMAFNSIHHQKLVFSRVLFPLLNADLLLSGKDVRLEQLDPDRLVFGIRAFLAIMTDLERQKPPPFPLDFADERKERGVGRISFQTKKLNEAYTRGKTGLVFKGDRPFDPFHTSHLPEMTQTFFQTFCEMLGTITQICNSTFGGQASIDEKLAPTNTKTPLELAVSSLKREATQAGELQRSLYQDLFHVAVQALPRCRPRNIPMPSLVNLLCIGTAHEMPQIAKSSAESLDAIARQGHAQIVAEKFGGFILNYDNRYSTMSDGGMLGQRHIDNTLRLYVELLSIWVDELRDKVRASNLQRIESQTQQPGQLDTSNVWSQVDRLESQGLFFLCSPTPRVRGYAVKVLELVTELEDALGQHNERISRTLHAGISAISIASDEDLTSLDIARLSKKPLPQLCSSDDEQDVALWSRLFPRVIRTVFSLTPMAVTQTREDICTRLYQLQDAMEEVAHDDRMYQTPSQSGSFDSESTRFAALSDSKKATIEQWKYYLMFASTTLNKTGTAHDPSRLTDTVKPAAPEPHRRARGNSQTGSGLTLTRRPTQMSGSAATDDSASVSTKETSHSRNLSSSSQQDSLNTASDLFQKVIPLLFASNKDVAKSAVAGLGAINANLYKLLLESLAAFSHSMDDSGRRTLRNHSRVASSPRRNEPVNIFRLEVVQVYQHTTSRFMQAEGVANDEWILHHLSNYTKEFVMWLQREDNRKCGDALKIQCCGLVEAFWPGIADRKDVHSLYPFQARKATFVLIETWYFEASGKSTEPLKESGEPAKLRRNETWTNVSAAKNQSFLRQAACRAMASLCAGKVQLTVGTITHSFSGKRILEWIVELLDRPEERQVSAGRKALRNIIRYNATDRALLDQALELLYMMPADKRSRCLGPYTDILVDVFVTDKIMCLEYWRILSVLLLALGNSQRLVRMAAVKLLRSYEGRQKETSKLHQLEIMVSDKTTNVYKQAQYEISSRLAERHIPLACHVFSDLARIFVASDQDVQRQLIPVLLPWMRSIELQVGGDGMLAQGSYVVLIDLIYMTRRCGSVLHLELEALWKALVVGPYENNLMVILHFLMDLCSTRHFPKRWPSCVQQVVVFLAHSERRQTDGTIVTNADKVTDFLLSRLTPRSMVVSSEKGTFAVQPPAGLSEMFPYVANIGDEGGIFDHHVQDATMSVGQNCLVLLVDLIVSPVKLEPDSIPGLLQVVMLLWDYHSDIIREHAREMLVHLIHELVLTKLDNEQMEQHIPPVEKLVNQIRSNDPSISWEYSEKIDQKGDHEVPAAMPDLVKKTISVFALVYPNIEHEWGKQAMVWAGCPVMHMACRSLQVYRCFLKPLDLPTLGGLVLLLSSIIAREDDASKQYAMELLRTCRSIAHAETRADGELLPLLFWTVYASLETPNEPEFREALATLRYILGRLDFSSPALVQRLCAAKPVEFALDQGLLVSFVYKGCRSRETYTDTIKVLDSLIVLPANDIIGDDTRVLFCFLANLPRFLEHFDEIIKPEGIIASAANLASAAKFIDEARLWQLLQNFVKGAFLGVDEFLKEAMMAISELSFFRTGDIEMQSLKFVMGMLGNSTPWIKEQTLKILQAFMLIIDMRKPELADQGPDLVMPLLRLLQSSYLPQALKVLDNVLPLKSTPLGQQHLEMSMVGSRSSQAIRRVFDETKSFYGIPEASGWSVAQPKMAGLRVAGHIRVLGQKYTPASDVALVPTPEIQFYSEESAPLDYFAPSDGNASRNVDPFVYPTVRDQDMGDLVTQLSGLDDFFDEPTPDSGDANSSFTALSRQNSNERTTPQASQDMRSNRFANSKSGEDVRATPPRQQETMSPSSFVASPATPMRPGMVSRAMTSPAVEKRTPNESVLSIAPSESETLSDDDLSTGRTSTSDRSLMTLATTSTEGVPTRARSGSKSGRMVSSIRSVSRRLTGAKRAQLDISPEVPKVPEFYMNQQVPRSSDP